MKKILALGLLLAISLGTTGDLWAAAKKNTTQPKKKVVKKKITRKKRSRRSSWPSGPRPVFPVYLNEKEKAPPLPLLPNTTAISPKTDINVTSVEAKPSRVKLFGEAGIGGGGLLVNVDFSQPISERLSYAAGVGYGLGNQYNLALLELARITKKEEDFSWGGLLQYAMYSNAIKGIPGLPDTSGSQSLLGIGLFAQKQFASITGRIGFSTALGLIFSAGREF